MTKFSMPVEVVRNSLTITWGDMTYRTIGSEDAHIVRGTRRANINVDSPGSNLGRVRLLSSAGFADGCVVSGREVQIPFFNLEIELFGDVDAFVEGTSDWVMIQYEI